MAARLNQKLKILYILDILKKYSDEETPINATEICEKLFSLGVTAERKSIYSDIDALIDYGYDIIKTRTPRFGYFLAEREFELPEIYLLADAVRSADFITPKKTRELLLKFDSLLSVNQAAKHRRTTYISAQHKGKNEEIFYNIDKINSATEKGVKIKTTYCKRKLLPNKKIVTEEKELIISPYATLWQNDHYYLVGNNEKYDNLIHLRLERMKHIEITNIPARPFCEVSEYSDRFDVADYAAKTFNMFGGQSTEVEFRCSNDKLEQIIDRFSEEITVYKLTEKDFCFRTTVIESEGLINWILSFGADIEVLNPQTLREKICNRINALKEIY